MTRSRSIPILMCSVAIAVVVCIWIYRSRSAAHTGVSCQVFQTSNGWGYNIVAGGNVIIHQPVIPARSGSRGFENSSQAQHTGELLLRRMGSQHFPAVTPQEVDSIISLYHE